MFTIAQLKRCFVFVIVSMMDKGITGLPYERDSIIFPFNLGGRAEVGLNSSPTKPTTGLQPSNPIITQDKLRPLIPPSFVKFDSGVRNILSDLNRHVITHNHLDQRKLLTETILLHANHIEFMHPSTEKTEFRKAETSFDSQGTSSISKKYEPIVENTDHNLKKQPSSIPSETSPASTTTNVSSVLNEVIDIDNEFGKIFLEDTNNLDLSTQETTTDLTTETYETTTYEDDNLNRMGVPAGVVASLLG